MIFEQLGWPLSIPWSKMEILANKVLNFYNAQFKKWGFPVHDDQDLPIWPKWTESWLEHDWSGRCELPGDQVLSEELWARRDIRQGGRHRQSRDNLIKDLHLRYDGLRLGEIAAIQPIVRNDRGFDILGCRINPRNMPEPKPNPASPTSSLNHGGDSLKRRVPDLESHLEHTTRNTFAQSPSHVLSEVETLPKSPKCETRHSLNDSRLQNHHHAPSECREVPAVETTPPPPPTRSSRQGRSIPASPGLVLRASSSGTSQTPERNTARDSAVAETPTVDTVNKAGQTMITSSAETTGAVLTPHSPSIRHDEPPQPTVDGSDDALHPEIDNRIVRLGQHGDAQRSQIAQLDERLDKLTSQVQAIDQSHTNFKLQKEEMEKLIGDLTLAEETLAAQAMHDASKKSNTTPAQQPESNESGNAHITHESGDALADVSSFALPPTGKPIPGPARKTKGVTANKTPMTAKEMAAEGAEGEATQQQPGSDRKVLRDMATGHLPGGSTRFADDPLYEYLIRRQAALEQELRTVSADRTLLLAAVRQSSERLRALPEGPPAVPGDIEG